MPIQAVRQRFETLSEDVFKHKHGGALLSLLDPLGWAAKVLMVLRVTESMYRTKPLRKALHSFLSEDRMLFTSNPKAREARATRVAVTSTKDDAATACLITNYNRPQIDRQISKQAGWGNDLDGYVEDRRNADFEREDRDSKEMKAWEAGLATSAAPFYFKPFVKEETGKDYVDGALHSNMPVSYALAEMRNIWPELGKCNPDILLSVGTGIQDKEVVFPRPL